MITVIVKILHLFFKICRLHRQHGLKPVVYLMIIQDRNAGQQIICRAETPKQPQACGQDDPCQHQADNPKYEFFITKISFDACSNCRLMIAQ